MNFLLDLSPVFENALFAVTGAALASSSVWLFRRFLDWRHERHFSITGEYRATYEDEIDGEIVQHTEAIRLKQRGLRVVAEHDGRDTNQGWVSEGKIDPITQYITGYYRAKAVTDAGVGVFILAPKSDELLEGIWAGYNNATKQITNGRYIFKRALPVTVRRAKKADLIKVMHIASAELGEDYLTLEDLQGHFDNDFVYVADYRGDIAGFTIARMVVPGTFKSDVLKDQKYRVPNDLRMADNDGKMGLLQSIATQDRYKGKGVANKMVRTVLQRMEKRGAQKIVSVGWTTDTVHVGSVLEGHGFIQRAEFEKFWAEESVRKDYECPDCGEPPCGCTATLFSKT